MSTVKILAHLAGSTRLIPAITRLMNANHMTALTANATAICGSMRSL